MYSHGHSLTIQAVETRWRGVSLAERAASASHFTDLCDAFGDPTSADADITGGKLKKRLRLNLYNACPAWPALDHPALGRAA